MSTTVPTRRSRFARVLGVVSACVGCLFAAWAVGQLARDVTWATGLCFYLPSVVMVIVALALFGLTAVARRRSLCLLAAALALPPVLIVVLVENRFTSSSGCDRCDLRLVHWNTGGRPARPGVGEHLIAERADVYVLTDVPNASHTAVLRDQLGTGYTAVTFANLAVIGRGDVRAEGWLINRGEFEVQAVTWTPPDRSPVHLLVCDLPSDVWVARHPMLQEVNALIEQTGPDLVVGDFNAPRRSWSLAHLPDGYRHAYDTCGGGWGSTWPVPVPLYSLDQCLFGPKIRPRRYRLGGLHGGSYHRYQVFDFGISTDG